MNALPFLSMTLVGGPTALIRIGDSAWLTDPTFDDAGGEYPIGTVSLRKTGGPALGPEALPPVDVVLLSHDQHADNLDRAGLEVVRGAARVLTTPDGRDRLALPQAVGLVPWESTIVRTGGGEAFTVTATPARHGPAGIEPVTGAVTGFVVTHAATGRDLLYVTGDTCWFAGVEEVSRRFRPEVVVLFAGAAQTRGPFHLTMDANDAIETAVHFPGATIVPVHHEGWAHFTQSADDLAQAFRFVGLESRLLLLKPGVETVLRPGA